MFGEKKAKSGMKQIGIASVVLLAVLSVGWAATEGFLGESEHVLIVGVPQHQQATWTAFLEKEAIPHRLDLATRSLYIYQDPIPVLEKASLCPELGVSVKRALLERELEKEFRSRWKKVSDPRVCLAFPDPEIGETEEGEPVSMVFAEGLSEKEIAEVRTLFSSRVEGLAERNIVIIGGSWRPWPGYGTSKKKMQVAQKSAERSER